MVCTKPKITCNQTKTKHGLLPSLLRWLSLAKTRLLIQMSTSLVESVNTTFFLDHWLSCCCRCPPYICLLSCSHHNMTMPWYCTVLYNTEWGHLESRRVLHRPTSYLLAIGQCKSPLNNIFLADEWSKSTVSNKTTSHYCAQTQCLPFATIHNTVNTRRTFLVISLPLLFVVVSVHLLISFLHSQQVLWILEFLLLLPNVYLLGIYSIAKPFSQTLP